MGDLGGMKILNLKHFPALPHVPKFDAFVKVPACHQETGQITRHRVAQRDAENGAGTWAVNIL